jgi:hypothetical protein
MVPLEGEPVPWRGELGVCWDGDDAGLHRARVRGPARVTFAVPVQVRARRGLLVARSGANEPVPAALVLCGGEVLEVRP